VTGAGGVTTGPVASRTVTVNEAVPVLPDPSCAEHDTVVRPSANTLPDDGSQVVGAVPLMASSAVAVNVTAAPAALVASATMGAGTVTTGGTESTTVTCRVARAVLPAASVAT
jgi:hypothetical protein